MAERHIMLAPRRSQTLRRREPAGTFQHYPHIGPVLPGDGIWAEQIRELETITPVDCDLVVIAAGGFTAAGPDWQPTVRRAV